MTLKTIDTNLPRLRIILNPRTHRGCRVVLQQQCLFLDCDMHQVCSKFLHAFKIVYGMCTHTFIHLYYIYVYFSFILD